MSLDDVIVFVVEDCPPAVTVDDIDPDECVVIISCWILRATSKLPAFDSLLQLPPIRISRRNKWDVGTSLTARLFESKPSSFKQRP